MTFCDPALMVQRCGPGKAAGWIGFSIVMACVVTFGAIVAGIELLIQQMNWSPRAIDLDWIRSGLIFFVAFWMLASWFPPSRLARSLRVAVLLPVLQAVVLALAWPVWHKMAPLLPRDGSVTSFVAHFPFAPIAAATAVGFAGFAYLVARKRSGEWIHGFAMLALSELLLLGLWLPLACAAWPGGHGEWWTAAEPVFAHARAQIALVVIPPTVVACAFTAFALRRPGSLPMWRTAFLQFLAAALVCAIVARFSASARAMVLYTNFLPVLFVAAIVAIAALLALGTLTWSRAAANRRALRDRGAHHGVIVVDDDHEPAIGVEITSWLRGPRVIQRPFAVATAQGTLPIRGARVVAPLPAATTQLRAGECIAVLRPGDAVTVAGYLHAQGDPFRTSAAPIATEVVVGPTPLARQGFANVTLAMWRPCVAYLLIVTAVALPGLAALLAE